MAALRAHEVPPVCLNEFEDLTDLQGNLTTPALMVKITRLRRDTTGWPNCYTSRSECGVHWGRPLTSVDLLRHYSNRPDLKVAVILSHDSEADDTGAEVTTESVIRSRRPCDRFSLDDLQTMIDLYRSGVAAKQVAEKFSVSLRSVKRLLRQCGVRRERGHLTTDRGGTVGCRRPVLC